MRLHELSILIGTVEDGLGSHQCTGKPRNSPGGLTVGINSNDVSLTDSVTWTQSTDSALPQANPCPSVYSQKGKMETKPQGTGVGHFESEGTPDPGYSGLSLVANPFRKSGLTARSLESGSPTHWWSNRKHRGGVPTGATDPANPLLPTHSSLTRTSPKKNLADLVLFRRQIDDSNEDLVMIVKNTEEMRVVCQTNYSMPGVDYITEWVRLIQKYRSIRQKVMGQERGMVPEEEEELAQRLSTLMLKAVRDLSKESPWQLTSADRRRAWRKVKRVGKVERADVRKLAARSPKTTKSWQKVLKKARPYKIGCWQDLCEPAKRNKS
ncbi:hypothetical protein J6590_083856 [Homalodisca vitripennis]|nr:hypothetical protein J6590_083856 [Homalodisca vitripennis]